MFTLFANACNKYVVGRPGIEENVQRGARNGIPIANSEGKKTW